MTASTTRRTVAVAAGMGRASGPLALGARHGARLCTVAALAARCVPQGASRITNIARHRETAGPPCASCARNDVPGSVHKKGYSVCIGPQPLHTAGSAPSAGLLGHVVLQRCSRFQVRRSSS